MGLRNSQNIQKNSLSERAHLAEHRKSPDWRGVGARLRAFPQDTGSPIGHAHVTPEGRNRGKSGQTAPS